jgi:DNA-binding Xre family transcriptional regulator
MNIIISGRCTMTVSFNKLWKKLIDLGISRSELRVKAGISTRQLAKLGKNENVTTDVLVKVCKALDCNVDEIMDIIERKEENA